MELAIRHELTDILTSLAVLRLACMGSVTASYSFLLNELLRRFRHCVSRLSRSNWAVHWRSQNTPLAHISRRKRGHYHCGSANQVYHVGVAFNRSTISPLLFYRATEQQVPNVPNRVLLARARVGKYSDDLVFWSGVSRTRVESGFCLHALRQNVYAQVWRVMKPLCSIGRLGFGIGVGAKKFRCFDNSPFWRTGYKCWTLAELETLWYWFVCAWKGF